MMRQAYPWKETHMMNPHSHTDRIGQVMRLQGLICFWDFQTLTDDGYISQGLQMSVLQESGGPVATANDGVFGSRSIRLGDDGYLSIPRSAMGRLNIHGPNAQLSVVTWLKRQPATNAHACQAVAGVWNEHAKRQYCLFLNLRIWDSADQVCAHVSGIGDATPGYKYCMDAAIGHTPVPMDQWQCCAMTYDGQYARAYLNGQLDHRGDRNPYAYDQGIFDGGEQGGDFTVGAVARPQTVDDQFQEHGSVVSNRYFGLLGGLAVFDRALTDEQMKTLGALHHA